MVLLPDGVKMCALDNYINDGYNVVISIIDIEEAAPWPEQVPTNPVSLQIVSS
jgi:hypothetical protein